MSVGYINLDPSLWRTANDGPDPNQTTDLTSLLGGARSGGAMEQQMRSAETFWADNAGPPEERAARQAVNLFRSNFASAWNKYSQQTLADAHFGYSDYSDAIDKSRDKALASVSGDAKDIAAPILDGLHQQGMQIGLDHCSSRTRRSCSRPS